MDDEGANGYPQPDEEPQVGFRFDVPTALEAGGYANVATVFHSAHEFTIDFGVTQALEPAGLEDDLDYVIPVIVTARVRLPITAVFDVMAAMNDAMGRYEAQWGKIYTPQALDQQADQEESDDVDDGT